MMLFRAIQLIDQPNWDSSTPTSRWAYSALVSWLLDFCRLKNSQWWTSPKILKFSSLEWGQKGWWCLCVGKLRLLTKEPLVKWSLLWDAQILNRKLSAQKGLLWNQIKIKCMEHYEPGQSHQSIIETNSLTLSVCLGTLLEKLCSNVTTSFVYTVTNKTMLALLTP